MSFSIKAVLQLEHIAVLLRINVTVREEDLQAVDVDSHLR